MRLLGRRHMKFILDGDARAGEFTFDGAIVLKTEQSH